MFLQTTPRGRADIDSNYLTLSVEHQFLIIFFYRKHFICLSEFSNGLNGEPYPTADLNVKANILLVRRGEGLHQNLIKIGL